MPPKIPQIQSGMQAWDSVINTSVARLAEAAGVGDSAFSTIVGPVTDQVLLAQTFQIGELAVGDRVRVEVQWFFPTAAANSGLRIRLNGVDLSTLISDDDGKIVADLLLYTSLDATFSFESTDSELPAASPLLGSWSDAGLNVVDVLASLPLSAETGYFRASIFTA